jgi:SAM-dependent MidA family methyltransferase
LLERIRREIDSRGSISFARFMDLALHDPRGGYYARGPARLGRDGDFFTASDVGRGFGRCIARQVIEIDGLLGQPNPFHLVEFGAGRGLLARDILDALAEIAPGLPPRLRYLMVDRSAAMRDRSARLAPGASALAPREIGEGYEGCVLAVELFDALPVRRVRRRGGELLEVRVGMDESRRLVERETPASEALAALAAGRGAAAAEGTEAEIAPGLADQLDTMQRSLRRGVLIIVDYGYPAEELYDASRRRGTLLAYHGHATNEAFLERVGEQDLTAHVDFTALEEAAGELGLDPLGRTTQDRFLVANGILEYFEQQTADEAYSPDRVKERMQAMQLIHPSGMGRTFKVLMLSKGIHPTPTLAGLSDPFAPDGSAPTARG